jgi:hypothetical protein
MQLVSGAKIPIVLARQIGFKVLVYYNPISGIKLWFYSRVQNFRLNGVVSNLPLA